MSDDIAASLGRYISAEILKDPARRLTDDEPIVSSGLVDSFSLVDLALYVESAFGVRIDDTELTAQVFDSVGELARLVRSRLPAS